ncbi:MAG: cell division protein FtsZ [Firmicutes bacterium]|nr:cell division protein FtsZ [Bacillota bacterium]
MQYAETYKSGNTTVHIIAPVPKSLEEIDRIINEFHQAGWEIWEEILEREKETA